MNSINNFRSHFIEIRGQLHQIGTLHEDERLKTSNNAINGKMLSPQRFVNEKDGTVKKIACQTLACISKIFQELHRTLTRQSTQTEIDTFSTQIKTASDLIKDLDLTKNDDRKANKQLYRSLNELGCLLRTAKKSREGLENYRLTCSNGNASFIRENIEVRQYQANQIGEQIDKLNKDVIQTIEKKLADFKASVHEADKNQTNEIIENFLDREAAIDRNHVRITAEAAKAALSEKYHAEVVKKAMKRLQLNHKEAVTTNDVKAIIIDIAANLTLEDVHKIDPSIEKQNLIEFTSQIRDIDTDRLLHNKHVRYARQIKHDIALIKNVYQQRDEYDPKKQLNTARRFAYTDYISRDLAYYLYDHKKAQVPEGILFSYWDKKGNLVLSEIHTLHSRAGLHVGILKPVFTEDKDKVKMQVFFRGTACKSSIKRDLSLKEKCLPFHFEGPGAKSFNSNADKLTQRLQKHINDLCPERKTACVEVMGHSLGASDSQRMIIAVTERMMKKQSLSKKIHGINLFAYNAPAIEGHIASQFIKNVEILDHVSFKLRYFGVKNHRDPVESIGTVRLGYINEDSQRPKNLHLSKVTKTIDSLEQKREDDLFDFPTEEIKDQVSKVAKFIEFLAFGYTAHTDYFFKGKNYDSYISSIRTNYKNDIELWHGKLNEPGINIAEDSMIMEELITPFGRFENLASDFFEKILHPSRKENAAEAA
ncbi:MAG: hypothetical protein H7A37_09985 [Chlamydiales bacterium]|nr:hypothetical protein [Chlamydiia bacterium]MCP5508606.1 hypothetical protein [Chlamydiales bacterium]